MYMIDTILMKGLSVRVLCKERAQIGRYAADHRVAFPDLLNTADEGQLQHTKLCLFSSKTNRMHDTEMVQDTSPMIVANVNYCFRK